MKRVVVSILGEDRPGIVHAVAAAMSDVSCNIREVSQTILQTEFAAIIVADIPGSITPAQVRERLALDLTPMGLTVAIKDFKAATPAVIDGEPFVITLRGNDQQGMIAAFSGVIAGFGVNIVNLKAISRKDEPTQVVIVFEVDVPQDVERMAFRQALRFKAEELGVEISVQHRDIFEAIHRI